MKNVVFLGSKPVGYFCFKHLIEEAAAMNVNIVGLLSKETSNPVKSHSLVQLAEENNIPVLSALPDILTLPQIDILISVQYHDILKQEHISLAKQIAINLHMAPLPEYRGCNQFSFAIINGDKEFGTTIHRLETGIDSGDIIFESRFPVPQSYYVDELFDLTVNKSVELFKSSIEKIINGDYTLKPQAEFASTRKSSFHLRSEIGNLKQIDLDWPGDKIEKHIRATSMAGFEPPCCVIGGKKIYFTTKY